MTAYRTEANGREGDLERRAAEVVETAERSLASLAGEALARREYARAAALMSLAQRFSQSRQDFAGETLSTAGRDGNGVQEQAPEEHTGAAKKKYPRFRREGDTLVKVGWSKSARKTYEHRSPQSILLQLVAAMSRVGADGKQFATEDLLPLRDQQGQELPTYQVYLCIAWLVAAGLLRRHGRQGYTVARDATGLRQMVEAAWAALPSR